MPANPADILNKKQLLLIEHLPEEIKHCFYLAGGTALSAFYLGHRVSENMDFFADSEQSMPSVQYLTAILKGMPSISDLRFQRLFDRRIFVAMFEDGNLLKVEFTSYPFISLDERPVIEGTRIDAPLNIITGKLFALADRFEPKDYVDIYFFLREFPWEPRDLIKKTEERFGVKGLDFIIPERLLQANSIKAEDLPMMVKDLDPADMKAFLLNTASLLIKGHSCSF